MAKATTATIMDSTTAPKVYDVYLYALNRHDGTTTSVAGVFGGGNGVGESRALSCEVVKSIVYCSRCFFYNENMDSLTPQTLP